jgi:hypothetical protein
LVPLEYRALEVAPELRLIWGGGIKQASHWKVRRLGTLEDLIDEGDDTAAMLQHTRPVDHHTTRIHQLGQSIRLRDQRSAVNAASHLRSVTLRALRSTPSCQGE